MDIQPIINQITHLAAQGYQKGKTGIVWCGHAIKTGYSNYLIPTVQKLALYASQAFLFLKEAVKNAPLPLLFIIGGNLCLIGLAMFSFGNQKTESENPHAKTALKLAGISAFLGGAALTTLAAVSLL